MEMLHFRLFGTFKALGPHGEDLTPRGAKACGLLAILLLSQDTSRGRNVLQGMLWSDRGEEQAAASLRQALTEIRKAFGRYSSVLKTDKRTVSLDRQYLASEWDAVEQGLQIPKRGGQRADFLENLRIRDSAFNEWLEECRSVFRMESDVVSASTSGRESATRGSIPRIIVGVPGAPGASNGAIGDIVCHKIAQGLAEFGTYEVIDWKVVDPEIKIQSQSTRFDLLLSSTTTGASDGAVTQLLIHSKSDGKLLWQTDLQGCPNLAAGRPAAVFKKIINQSIDKAILETSRLEDSLSETGRCREHSPSVVHRVFSLENHERELAQSQLKDMFEHDQRGIYLSWQAFLLTYLVGERQLQDRLLINEQAVELLTKSIELEPQNSMVLALGCHVYCFLLNDFYTGYELGHRSTSLNPNNPLGWAFFGAASLYLGRYEEGFMRIAHARSISGEGPYRYIIDTLFCIAATLTGRFEYAAMVGEATSRLTPGYAPPLRYLTAVYQRIKRHDLLEGKIARLQTLEPDFSIEMLKDPSYPTQALRSAEFFD